MTETINFAAGQATLLAQLRRQEAQLAAMNATIGNLETRLTGLEVSAQRTAAALEGAVGNLQARLEELEETHR